MEPAPIPANEEQRLAELRRLDLLDTPPEEASDLVTRELAQTYDVPISTMSLVDKDREFWKSQVGFPEELASARESPRDTSLSGHVVAANELLVVEDVWKDKRFANNPFLRNNGIRFYAGAPLQTSTGHAIGALCIMDKKPRRLNESEADTLRVLAQTVMKELELRQSNREAGAELASTKV